MKIHYQAITVALAGIFLGKSSAFTASALSKTRGLAPSNLLSSLVEQPESQFEQPESQQNSAIEPDVVDALQAAVIEAPVPKRTLPGWGVAINNKLQMPMITHADKYHLHAFSAVGWFIGAYGHLFPAWFKEFQANDWSAFSQITPAHWGLFFSGTTMLATGLTMLPSGKNLKNYSGQMRSAMSSCSVLIAMSAAFMLQGDTLPFGVIMMTKLTALTAYLYMLWEGATEGRPWHILPIMNEMKLHNNNPFVITGAYGLSILWYWMAALCVAHGVLGDPGSLTDVDGGSLASAFAAQMAVALAVAPANDALVAGTLMKNEAFLKKNNKKRITLVDDPKVGLRQAYWLEYLQIVCDYGPAFVTMGAAIACGHSELVSDFFYFDTMKELLSMVPSI